MEHFVRSPIYSLINYLLVGDNCNYDQISHSPYIITVTASNGNGSRSLYSESCSSAFVNAPSNDLNFNYPGITTITHEGGFTNPCRSDFGGLNSTVALH